MTELKDIIKPHFKKIGFDVKSYFIEKSKFKYSVVKNLFYTDEGINIVLGEKGGNGLDALSSDYATILTSKEYIDCLKIYIILNKIKLQPYRFYKEFSLLGNIIFNISNCLCYGDIDDFIFEITPGLYDEIHNQEFITNITNDE